MAGVAVSCSSLSQGSLPGHRCQLRAPGVPCSGARAHPHPHPECSHVYGDRVSRETSAFCSWTQARSPRLPQVPPLPGSQLRTPRAFTGRLPQPPRGKQFSSSYLGRGSVDDGEGAALHTRQARDGEYPHRGVCTHKLLTEGGLGAHTWGGELGSTHRTGVT